MNKALVKFQIKAVDEDARTLEGWATTPDVDRVGDIVMPKGAQFDLPIPFLLDHNHSQVVGEVERVEVSEKGIKFWARIKKIGEEGEAKALCDKAWSYIKHGLRKAVSIGFRPIEFDVLPTGGLKFTSWEWFELSAVGVPAQANARITGTKSLSLKDGFVAEDNVDDTDTGLRAEAGVIDDPLPEPEGSAAIGKTVKQVKLSQPARDGAKPFVIRSIKRTGTKS